MAHGAAALVVAFGLASQARGMGGGGGNNSQITAPATSDFARVLLGEEPTQDHTLSRAGSNATTYTATVTPANTGLTITADGNIPSGAGGNTEIITFNLENNANGSGSTGLKTFTVVIDNTAGDSGGANQGSADSDDSVSVTATVVANRDLIAGSASLGRVMINVNTASVNVNVDGGTADDNNATRVNLNNGSASAGGVTVTRTGGTNLFNTANETAPVGVVGNFSTTGAKSGSVNIASLLTNGETAITGTPTVDATVNVGYTATAVANRDLSQLGAAANLGKAFVGANTSVASATVSGGTGDAADDNNATRVNLTAGNASSGGVTVTNGTAFLFNDKNLTKSVNVQGNFATSGNKAGTVNVASLLTNGETSITGTPTVDATLEISYMAQIFQPGSLTANDSLPVGHGGSLTVSNAATGDGGLRAAGKVVASGVTSGSGWSVSGLNPGDVANGGGNTSGTVNFASAGKLNGIHLGSFAATFEHDDQTILGTTANDLGSFNWDLETTVAGNTGDASALLLAGQDYDHHTTRAIGQLTTAALIDGVAAVDRSVQMTFSNAVPEVVSDVVDLTGTGSDVFVLQLSYDASSMTLATEMLLRLGWHDGASWVEAIDGNSGGTPFFVNGAYDNVLSLGRHGVDTANNVVWAVVDHNSEFAVLSIPEPAVSLMIILGVIAAATVRRRRGWSAACITLPLLLWLASAQHRPAPAPAGLQPPAIVQPAEMPGADTLIVTE